MKKQAATPKRRMSTPPMAGPITRAEFISTLLRLTALGSRSSPTISETKVCRAGLSNRFTNPRPAASDVDLPQVGGVRHDQRAQNQGQHSRRPLGAVEHLALVDPVGDQATEGAEEQQRQELQAGGDGDVHPGAVQREEDQVRLRHRLHPCPRDGDDLAREVEPVVAHRDGAEGAAAGLAHASPHGSARRCSSNSTSSVARCCSSNVSSSRRRSRKAFLRVRIRSSAALAGGRDAHPGAPPVVGVRHPGHHPGLGQAGDDPRHGRRLDLLDGGQLPQRGAAVPAHRAERRGLRRRETAEGLLAQATLQPVDGAAQAAGHLFVGQLDGLRRHAPIILS